MDESDEVDKRDCGSCAIFVPDGIPKHEPNSFFISKGDLVALFNEIQSSVSDVFEACGYSSIGVYL